MCTLVATGVGLVATGAFTAAGGKAAAGLDDDPGRGRAVGTDRDAGFDGPPALSNFPCVIGRTTPGFLLAGGRDRLPRGSPDATCTV